MSFSVDLEEDNTVFKVNFFNLIKEPKIWFVFVLGFVSGLPLALVGATLQAWFRAKGVDIVTVGMLALVAQPYAYKVFWAPLLDRYSFFQFGRRRGWILLCQLLIAICILVMAGLDPNRQPMLIASIALAMAFFSASQDIVIDAYRTELLSPKLRGFGASIAIEGYRIAMIVSSGIALILADHIGWYLTYCCMAGLVLCAMVVTFFAPEPKVQTNTHGNVLALAIEAIGEFWQRKYAVAFIALIILYKLGDVFSHALTTPFLLDLGFSLTAIGTINKTVGLIASLLGILYGGVLLGKVGLYRALLFFGILQAISNLLYMWLAHIGANYTYAVIAFFLESLCGGMGTAAFTALLMSLCNPKYTATQYALFTSLMGLGRSYVGPASGFMVKYLGWSLFYSITAIIALPGILLIFYLRQSINQRYNMQSEVMDAADIEDMVTSTNISEDKLVLRQSSKSW